MNLWFRLLCYLLTMRSRPALGILETSRLQFRVLPNDLDINFHVNNGRYLSLMDLGRLDLIGSTGMLKVALRLGWRPIVGSLWMRYIRPLRLGQAFRIETRLLGWEGKWFYLEQRFYSGSQLVADGLVKALFVDKRGSLTCEEVLGHINYAEPSPPLPATASRL